MIADTLVSNFYSYLLENLVASSWSGSEGPSFPGNTQGHVEESSHLGKEEPSFQGILPRFPTVLLAHCQQGDAVTD